MFPKSFLINIGIKDECKLDTLKKVFENIAPSVGERMKIIYNTGNTCVIDFYSKDYVIQVFFSQVSFLKVKQLINTGVINNGYNVIPMEINDLYQCILWEKVIPVEEISNLSVDNQKKLYKDITTAIETNQFGHGQPTLANIGYSEKREKFVLFDFNKSTYERTLLNDLLSFCGSFNSKNYSQ